jgi:hypothetical protein
MSEEKFETVVFKKKTFGQLLEEIHTNSKNTDKLIFGMVQDMKDLIETLGDAIQLAPVIATYVKMAIDNNDHIIKIASIVQKSLDKAKEKGNETEALFSEQEKAELAEIMQEWEKSAGILPDSAGSTPKAVVKPIKILPDSAGSSKKARESNG